MAALIWGQGADLRARSPQVLQSCGLVASQDLQELGF